MKKRRYKSESQILSAIDQAHERLDMYAAMYHGTGDKRRAKRNIERIENQVLPHLGRKLSEFRTTIFQFVGNKSIPV